MQLKYLLLFLLTFLLEVQTTYGKTELFLPQDQVYFTIEQTQQIGRITLASVEITSGFADIMVRYTDLCEGNEDFCKAFQEYNTYLQLGLLSSGLIRAKFSTARNTAKDEYLLHRETLVNKYGETDPRVKELNVHFGLANGGLN